MADVKSDEECIICYKSKNRYKSKIDTTCGKCKISICLVCYSRLYGMCPVCDREELNQKKECGYCGDEVLPVYYMVCECDICGTDLEGCEDCFKYEVLCDICVNGK